MLNEEFETIIISEDETCERLDKILANRFREVKSRTYFQFLIENGNILLNGSSVKKCVKPKIGDEVQIHFVITPEIGLEPEPIPLNILYEDEEIIVVNKPSGLVVHPALGNWSGTFVNALLYHCQNLLKDDSTLRPGIVHRLDKETSGLLIAAKTSLAQQRLIEMFAARRVHKEYLAICLGNPGDREINVPIGRHPVHRKLMTVAKEGGRNALSICKTLAYNDKLSLVNILLATGRTHQIRVHMKHIGSPVLGDSSYGNSQINEKYGAQRQMLHAEHLRFNHPISNQPLEFHAEIPEDMQKLIQKNFKR